MAEHKSPANDPDAEAAVIGACLIEAAAVRKTMLMLEQADFYHTANATVFQAIANIAEDGDGENIDLVTVGARLRAAGLLESVGGMEYMAGCQQKVSNASFVDHYCRIVRGHSLSRRITKALRKTYEEESAESLQILTDLIIAKEGNNSQSLYDVRTDLGPTIESILNYDKPRFLTGFPTIDEVTGGVEAGELVTIGARTSGGKTALKLRIALNMAMAEHDVLYITSEMRIDSLIRRILPQATQIPAWKFRKRNLSEEDRERVRILGNDNIGSLPLKFLAKGRIGLKEIRAAIIDSGCKVVFIDYLQRCRFPKANQESTAIFDFMSELKDTMLNCSVAGFISSQLDRRRDKTKEIEPELADFRGSSGIESESDHSWLLWKPLDEDILKSPTSIAPPAGSVRIKMKIGKGRDSGSGQIIDMDLDRDQVRFYESSMNKPGEERFA